MATLAQKEAWIAGALEGIELLKKNAQSEGPSADGTTWKECSKQKDIVIYQCAVPGSSMLRFKAIFSLPYAPAVVSAFVSDNEHRRSWDSNLSKIETTELGTDERGKFHLLHIETKAVGPVSARDFVDAVAIVSLPDGSIANGGRGLTDGANDVYPEARGVVRGLNGPGGGWIFRPVQAEGGVHTEIVYVIHCDLKGWLPHVVVNNALVGSYVSFYKDLTRAMAAKATAKAPTER